MCRGFTISAVGLLLGVVLFDAVSAQEFTKEETQRQNRVLKTFEETFAADISVAEKLAHFQQVIGEEQRIEMFDRLLKYAPQIASPELEEFLIDVLPKKRDAGVRMDIAKLLGRIGTEKSLPVLAETMRSDPLTIMSMGCCVTKTTARRDATFALAELAVRFPKLADEAAAKIRALPPVEGDDRSECLADARIQALYQITQDRKLLKPFFERLRSRDETTRIDGLIAFQFVKLTVAPLEVIVLAKDYHIDVRQQAMMTLGDIADPKTVPLLMSIASDEDEHRKVRGSAVHALGRMRTPLAVELMEDLTEDEAQGLQVAAAIALYRITGKRTEHYPKGYGGE